MPDYNSNKNTPQVFYFMAIFFPYFSTSPIAISSLSAPLAMVKSVPVKNLLSSKKIIDIGDASVTFIGELLHLGILDNNGYLTAPLSSSFLM